MLSACPTDVFCKVLLKWSVRHVKQFRPWPRLFIPLSELSQLERLGVRSPVTRGSEHNIYINGFLLVHGWAGFPGNQVGEWGLELQSGGVLRSLPRSRPSWPLCPCTEQPQRTSRGPPPPDGQKGEAGREEEYCMHWGQEVKGRSQAVWWPAGPREPQATRDLRHTILSPTEAGPQECQALPHHGRHPSPVWEGQQVSPCRAPLSWQGTENPVLFGNLNRDDKCSWACELCGKHDRKPEINKRLWAKMRSQWQSRYPSELFMLRGFQGLVSAPRSRWRHVPSAQSFS